MSAASSNFTGEKHNISTFVDQTFIHWPYSPTQKLKQFFSKLVFQLKVNVLLPGSGYLNLQSENCFVLVTEEEILQKFTFLECVALSQILYELIQFFPSFSLNKWLLEYFETIRLDFTEQFL